MGAIVLDLSKHHIMACHYNVIHTKFNVRCNLIELDTDSLVDDIRHLDIFDWTSQNRDGT